MTVLLIVVAVIGVLLGVWLLWRLFGPDLEPRYDGPQIRPIQVPGRTVFVDGREFFVREVGPEQARPLVLVHGWSFDGEMAFFRVIPELSQRYRLIVPDHRNHGKSERIRGPFDVEDLASELAGMLTELGYERVDLFGYSLGGFAAQVLARRSPERVGHLILAATAAYPIERFRLAYRIAFWLGRAFARVSTKEAALFTYRLLLRHGLIDDSEERWMWAALLNRDPDLFYESGKAALRFDARPWANELTVPTMVIIPTKDEIVPPRTQRDLASRLHDPVVVELDGLGHDSIISHPEIYIKAIDEFIES